MKGNKIMKKTLRALMAIILVMSVLFVLPACKKAESGDEGGAEITGGENQGNTNTPEYSTPAEYMAYSMLKSNQKFTPENNVNDALSSFINNASKAVSVEMDASKALGAVASISGGNDAAELLKDAKLSGKLYFENGKVAAVGNVALAGAATDLSVFVDSGKVIIKTAMLDNAYGVDLNNIENNLKGSLLETAIGKDKLDLIFSTVSKAELDAMALLEDAGKLVEKYIGTISTSIENGAELSMTDNENGGKTVTVKFGTEALEKLINDVYSTVKSDSELKTFINKLADMTGKGEGSDISFEADDEIADFISEMKEVKPVFDITYVTDKDDCASKISVKFSAFAGGENEGAIICDIDLLSDGGYVVVMRSEGAAADSISEMKFEYKVTSNTEDSFVAEYKSTVDGEEVIACGISYSPKTGSYTETVCALVDGEKQTVTINGLCSISADKIMFTVDSVSADNKTINLGIDITVKTNDTMPSTPASFVEIAKITEQEIVDILTELSQDPLGSVIVMLLTQSAR